MAESTTQEQVKALQMVAESDAQGLVARGIPKWTKSEIAALKELCCPKDASPAEILSFWYVCKRTGLDPFARQIYLVRYGSSDEDTRGRCVIQVGVDGFRLVSMEAGGFAGMSEPTFEGVAKSKGIDELYKPCEVTHPVIARVRVSRFIDGEKVEFVGVSRWSEYAKYVKDKQTGEKRLNAMWSKMPYNQISKCAECAAHRKSAPMRLSGVYAPEEVGAVIDVVGTPIGGEIAAPKPATQIGQNASTEMGWPEKLWQAIMDSVGGNTAVAHDTLEKLTEFKGREGNTVSGVRDWKKLSDARAKASYGKFQKSK